MALGYDGTLFILAFDHRGSFKRKFGVGDDATAEQMATLKDAKRLVWEGFQKAVEAGAPEDAVGVLVDEEMGADIARDAKAAGFHVAMPVEKSGQPVFDFEYGDEFGDHIEEFDPSFSKVLVRWNPGDPQEDKDTQGPRLKRLGDWLHGHGRTYLFELLVPATDADLAQVDGDKARYDAELRPELTIATIKEIQDHGVEPDIWKIEGLDEQKDCERLSETIRTGAGREGVVAIVLGRGADDDAVDHWLRTGAPVEGYNGLAIGRSIWSAQVDAFVDGSTSREAAAQAIGDNFLRFINVYRDAER
jgi:myo-inositol catabolism protein IolC